MEQLDWCKRQKKGIRLIEPNENVARDYFVKADNALIMASTVESGEWKATGAYYACYDALYALLQMAGVKCKIHDCSIALMRFFDFQNEDIEFVKGLKLNRINAQYYVGREFALGDTKMVKDFVLRCRKISKGADFGKIREKIEKEVFG